MKAVLETCGTQDEIDPRLEQLIESVSQQMQAGETIDLDRFVAEHPEFAEQLRELVPAVAALIGLGTNSVAPEPGKDRAQVSDANLPQQQLGDFRLIREIGRGGMGTVFEAEQLSMGRRVALKVLPFAALAHEKSLQRFRNEVRAAASLDHRNIVSIYSVGEERGVHYYAMQLIRGQTLADLIADLQSERSDGSQLCVARASDESTEAGQDRVRTRYGSRRASERYRSIARLGIQAAEALQHAHDQGVLHRDIKPSNLMLDAERQLYVTDFGLARIEADAGMTMTGDLLGTLRYMAPEQALAKRVVIDHRADIYSLGATLYELLTLQPAFGETDRSLLLKQIAFDEPTQPRKLDRLIPAELETILLCATAKNPEERYQTAQQLADDLRAFQEHRPIKAKPPTFVGVVAKWSRRHRPLVWATASTSIVVAIAVAGSVGWSARDRQNRRLAVEHQLSESLHSIRIFSDNGDLEAAMAATNSAERLLSVGDVASPLQNSVLAWSADLKTLKELERIHLEMTMYRRGLFDLEEAALKFAEVLADSGLNLDDDDIEANAAKLRSSKICIQLVSFLDGLSTSRATSNCNVLVRLANSVDDNAWRKSFRQAVLRNDLKKLKELARSTGCESQPPMTITNITSQLYRRNATSEAISLLRRLQQSRPTDFWVNHVLGTILNSRNHGQDATDAVGYLRVAVGRWPASSTSRNNLAGALTSVGQLEEAEYQYREAARLDPSNALPCINLAYLFRESRPRERADWARRCYEIDPTIYDAYYMIAEGYALDGNFGAAIEWSRKFRIRKPEVVSILVSISEYQFKDGQTVEAQETLDELLPMASVEKSLIDAGAKQLETYVGRKAADEYLRSAKTFRHESRPLASDEKLQ